MRYVVLCLCWTIFAICGSQNTATEAQIPDEIIIFAASSLTDTFTILAEHFERDHNVQVTLNFAGSSTLATQILQGAPADIFASANQEQMQSVIDENLIAETDVSIFAENELILITPADNPANIQSIEDLAGENILLVLAAEPVPVRAYTNQLLENLLELYGNDFDKAVLANLVSEESNVRQVTARIVLGEADAGIVYRSDVSPEITEDVQIIELPEGTSPRASYPVAPLIESENRATAELFIEYVLSEAGQSILREWGFCSPDNLIAETTPEAEVTPEIDESQEIERSC